jgi:acyl-CoA synthetase (AMP-forming)/AMP-acid ligase II
VTPQGSGLRGLAAPTLPALLHERADEHGSARLYTYLADGLEETRSLSFTELLRDAQAVAAELQGRLRHGARALILADDAIEFIRAFMGCQLAGVIAVPVVPPFPSHGGARVATLRQIFADCEAQAILSGNPSSFRERLVGVAPELDATCWIAVDEVDAAQPAAFRAAPARPDDVSFLQYTSGSTSAPKGVVVTHDALMHNAALLYAIGSYGRGDRLVSWLPLYHDMGLTANVVLALYAGIEAVLMPPLVFAQRPARWLGAISRHRATVSGGPDFAYGHCVRRISAPEREQLDLSSWRVAFCGGEPVRADTLDAFAQAFGRAGFDARAWVPGYGLAECTVMATAVQGGRGATRLSLDSEALRRGEVVPGDGQTLIGCGGELLHRRLEIVDPVSRRSVPPGTIGEIWIGGPDVCAGYWRQPEETAATFAARLIGDEDETPFLRSGDLGFVHHGELYITGRAKDLVIVAGRNHYPQDLEATAVAAHAALLEDGSVAFAVERDGREHVVLVASLVPERARVGVRLGEVAARVRAAVSLRHGIAVDDVLLVDRKAVPKTSSGKLRRGACRELYERGELTAAR